MFILISFWVLSAATLPSVVGENPSLDGDISFQPNMIPEVDCYYEDYSFVFSLKSYFIRVRPFVIYDDSYYGMRQIVSWIKTHHPDVDYKWLVDKAVSAIHYGFNLTRLPEEVADKIDYLGFRLVDWNFPLSWFKLETVEMLEEGYNITRIHIPKANLCFSFEDLYPYGYSVEHVNSTYVLVGNVKGKTDLYADPITYSSPTITVIGDYSGKRLCWELWNASDTNGWNVVWNNQENDTQYQFDCRIVVGDGTNTTEVEDYAVQIVFSDYFITANYQNLITINGESTFTLGTLTDATTKSVRNPVSMIILEDDYHVDGLATTGNPIVNLYGFSQIGANGKITRNPLICSEPSKMYWTIWTSPATYFKGISVRPWNFDVYQMYLSYGYEGLDAPQGSTLDKIHIFDSKYYSGLRLLTYSEITVSNFELRNSDMWLDARYNYYLVNPDVDTYSITWYSSGSGKTYRQYIFDLTFTFNNGSYAEGTNVTITNDYLGTSDSWILTANGSIPEQTYSYGHYNKTGGNSLYDYNPYNITATLEGYQTYTQLINITKQEDLTIALTEEIEAAYNWFAATIIIAFFACFMTVYALTTKN